MKYCAEAHTEQKEIYHDGPYHVRRSPSLLPLCHRTHRNLICSKFSPFKLIALAPGLTAPFPRWVTVKVSKLGSGA